jgi:hypothetical protein
MAAKERKRKRSSTDVESAHAMALPVYYSVMTGLAEGISVGVMEQRREGRV